MEQHPVARGSYGDVYKEVWHSQKIAVKALRINQTSDLVKLLKVGVEFGPVCCSHLNQIPRSSRPKPSYGDSFLILIFCPSMGSIIWMSRHQGFALQCPE